MRNKKVIKSRTCTLVVAWYSFWFTCYLFHSFNAFFYAATIKSHKNSVVPDGWNIFFYEGDGDDKASASRSFEEANAEVYLHFALCWEDSWPGPSTSKLSQPTTKLLLATESANYQYAVVSSKANSGRPRMILKVCAVFAFALFHTAQSFVISSNISSSSPRRTNFPRFTKMTADENTSSTISTNVKIVEVRCHEEESPLLRQGVAELFKLYFDELYELGCDLGFQGFQNEWIDLPGKYDFEKRGGLFVATSSDSTDSDDIEVVGCIAIRPLDDKCGEVKRMYTKKSHRRSGVGKLLAKTIIDHAWTLEYDEIKLDSLERLKGAVALYENLGFSRIDPYCECPEEDHVCMNLFRNKE